MVSKFINKVRDRHALIFKVFLSLGTIFLLVFLLPKEGKFKYEFYKNKPWVHEDLFSPFDYAIKKTEEEMVQERKKIYETYSIYFDREEDKELQSLKKCVSWTDKNAEKYKVHGKHLSNYQDIAVKHLKEVYRTGILELTEIVEGKDKTHSILIIGEDNVGEETEIGELYSLKTAYDFILSKMEEHPSSDADFIMRAVEEALQHNIIYNQRLTEKDLQSELNNISSIQGGILKGEKIVSTGEIVTDEKYKILESLKEEYELKLGVSNSYFGVAVGQIMIILLLFYASFIFFRQAETSFFEETKNLLLVAILVVSFVAITAFLIKVDVNAYVIPFCIIPLLLRTFYGNRIAQFVYLVTILLASFLVPNSSEFLVSEIIVGMVVLYTILTVNKRAALFYTTVVVFLTFCLCNVAFSLLQDGSLKGFHWQNIGWFSICAGLTLLTYPFIFIFEKLFGFVSDVTLLELSDTNNKLLRDLNMKAPGTFQHSLQVSNLAEEAIQEIGGNPLLVRAGALYHDIGKTFSPAYFIENQSGGINLHDELGPEESAAIIIDHVIKGVELAKKHNLPEQVIDFIRTHHGTTKTMYFLNTFKSENPELEVDEKLFQYRGPNPYSRETAVLMMADSVEAASRSLSTYHEETITNLVEEIIDAQIGQDQFANANITFKDIATIKKLFVKKLMNIYHVRIAYPK